VGVSTVRGKIEANLSSQPKGKATIYLAVTQHADGPGSGPNPPVSADGKLHAFDTVKVPTPATQPYTSKMIGDMDVRGPAPLPDGCDDKDEGWDIACTRIGIAPEFDESAKEKGHCGQEDNQTVVFCPAPGTTENHLASVESRINLGRGSNGDAVGYLLLSSTEASADLSTPSALEAVVTSDVEVIKSGTSLRQLKAPQGLVDIVTIDAYTYEVRFYGAGDYSTTKDGNGLYPVPNAGAYFRKVAIANPDASATVYNKLRITEQTPSATVRVDQYEWDDTNKLWSLATGLDTTTGVSLRRESKSEVWNTEGSQRTQTRTVKSGDGTSVVGLEIDIYQLFPWGEERISHIIDPDGSTSTTSDQLVETWSYYEDPVADGDNYTHLKQHVTSQGYWERYSYDSSGRISQMVSQLNGSAAPDLEDAADTSTNLLTEYTYQSADLLGSDGMPGTDSVNELKTTVVRKLNGTELSRDYTISGSANSVNFTWQIQAASAAAAWDATANQASITFSHPYDGTALEGKPLKVMRANGDGSVVYDLSIYTYTSESLSPYGTVQVTTTDSGTPNTAATAVDFGTRSVSKQHEWGATVFDERYPIDGGSVNTSIKLSSQVVPGDLSDDYLDEFGRVQRINYLDGTYTTTSYDCCGIDQMRGRDGLVTKYDLYDGLKRPLSVTQAYGSDGAITTLYTYDAEGRITQTKRKGSDNVEVTVETDTYDAAGRITSRADANGNKTFHTYAPVSDSGKTYQETRTYPHDKSSGPIQVSWEDGQGQTVKSFTASTSASDWSGSAPAGNETLTKLSLSENGYDALGRQVTTKNYYDLSSNLYYQSQTVYDFLGRSIRQIDPMGDVTATVYGDDGRPISQWRGTDATGATAADPSNGGANDMVKVSETFYDTDRDGTGDRRPFVTRQTQLKAASTLSYAYTDYEYDTKHRLEWTKPQYGPWVKQAYDDGDRPTEQTTYANGSTSYILAQTTRSYDSTTKRLSSVQAHESDGAGGLSGNVLETTYAYDDAGRQVKVTQPQGGFAKSGYDAQGRVAWTAMCSEEGTTVDATNLTDDTVLAQTVNGYDQAGNLIQTTTYSRNHDATATGALADTPSAARVTYKATWYDKANRPTTAVDYGVNAP
jgi:YD repeat-containing protein